MTSDDTLIAGASPEADHAQTLGRWVTTLAEDALCVAEVSQQFVPGAPLRAPLRAGLRHLLHIERLSRGIEGLAMLEVAIMLRVTALLASPAQELDSETVLRLRADTPLIEELFPDEKDVIWRFCETLIETERGLASEQTSTTEPVPLVPEEAAADVAKARTDVEDESPSHFPAAPSDFTPSSSTPDEGEPSNDTALPTETEPSADADAILDDGANEGAAASPGDAVESSQPAAAPVVIDELTARIRVWAASYRAPTFGSKPHDLTRACAFVRTRVSAWAGP